MVHTETLVVAGIGENIVGQDVPIVVDRKGIRSRLIVGQMNRSTDIVDEGIDELVFLHVGMPDGAVRSVDHIRVLIRPDRQTRGRIEPFDAADLIDTFATVVDQDRFVLTFSDLNENDNPCSI